MTIYFKIIFWNVTKLKVLLYEFTKDFCVDIREMQGSR